MRLIAGMLISLAWLLTSTSSFALSSKAVPSYMEGLDAFADGGWPDAVSAFTCALDTSGDDPERRTRMVRLAYS